MSGFDAYPSAVTVLSGCICRKAVRFVGIGLNILFSLIGIDVILNENPGGVSDDFYGTLSLLFGPALGKLAHHKMNLAGSVYHRNVGSCRIGTIIHEGRQITGGVVNILRSGENQRIQALFFHGGLKLILKFFLISGF